VRETIGLDAVRVWHCNDAKAARGSKLDRMNRSAGHDRVGALPRLLNDERFARAAFIAETPVDAPATRSATCRRSWRW